MVKYVRFLYIMIGVVGIYLTTSCADDDSFSVSRDDMLCFSTDTVDMDTTFSNVPTVTHSFWIYNRSGKSLRCSSVRLEKGNQMGFRVNVDGTYLGSSVGYQVRDVEIRKGDSIRAFVELTSPMQLQDAPSLVTDNLVFALESGVEQKVCLKAYSWDAILMQNATVGRDTLIQTSKPIVVYGGLTVDSAAVLTIGSGTRIFFHEDAAIHVYGCLKTNGQVGAEVTLRGDRLDNMFDYLPYDQTPGRWQGIHLYASSHGNELRFTDLHGAYDGIIVDSSEVERQKLLLENATIHNCQGYGVRAEYAKLQMFNCQVTNVLHDCVSLKGANAEINGCTLAQFYPFDGNRGAAMSFVAPSFRLDVSNSLITGYADDVLQGVRGEASLPFEFSFGYSVIRTPAVASADSLCFTNVIYEDVADTVAYGRKHFILFDTENFRYDFRLVETSPAIGVANSSTSLPIDRLGNQRDDTPDVGCYEWQSK